MKKYKYDGTKRFNIKTFDCADTGDLNERHEAIREFTENLEKINEYQQKLFAEQKEGIIFVFQAMDAAGKDGAVRAVLSCLSPQGVSEHSFKVPSAEENRHDYLWRFWDAIPEKGSISIFNRSYYEDVLVQKIHKYYENNRYADRIDLDTLIDKRYEQIRNFEKYLWENSIRVVKIFLNVSKKEQAKRFISRIDTQKKNWKFSSSDIDERAYWDEYMDAYETCINRTARSNTPWYVVPADHKWYARLVISRIVLDELKNMDPHWPVLSEDELNRLSEYRERLTSEYTPDDADDETDNEAEEVMKLKPSDTAVGIALKNDRQALSEKKFRKLLKKTVFDNFCDRFGVSQQTQENLSRIYLDFEELEAKAEADDLSTVKSLVKEYYAQLSEELEGYGKEARKLQERFKKLSKNQIEIFTDETNSAYARFEDNIKVLMTEYECSVSSAELLPDDALLVFEQKVCSAFEAHRSELSEKLNAATESLAAIKANYSEMGNAFRKANSEDSAAPVFEENAEDNTCECEEEENPLTDEDDSSAEECTDCEPETGDNE